MTLISVAKHGVSSESAWLAWLILAVVINAYWIGYDIWAAKTDHYTMTKEMQGWLHGPISGPLCFGILMFVVGAFLYHMLIKAAG